MSARYDFDRKTLLFDSSDRSSQVKECLPLLPEVPKELLELKGIERKVAFLDYSYLCLCSVLPFVGPLTKELHSDAKSKGYREYRTFIDTIITTSDPATIVYQASRMKAQHTHLMSQAFKDYPLTLEEVFDLERVRSERSKVNKSWVSFVSSPEWNKISMNERKQREAAYLRNLDEASSMVWKIIHLGAECLSPDIRLSSKLAGEGYRSALDERLRILRVDELNKFHDDPQGYSLPKKSS